MMIMMIPATGTLLLFLLQGLLLLNATPTKPITHKALLNFDPPHDENVCTRIILPFVYRLGQLLGTLHHARA